MYISKIVLNNFKSYQSQTFEFPKPKGSKNLILIGGLNGYGKTSILEALYLGLYGAGAIEYLGRAGLKTEAASYAKFLTKAFYGHADTQKPMSVKIEFLNERNKGYSIERLWYFNKNRSWDDEELHIFEVVDGIPKKPRREDDLNDILDREFVVPHLAPFFFFDGEEVKSLAGKDKVEQVKLAIDNFLGIVVLKNLQKRLRDYQANRRKELSNVDEGKLNDLVEKINKLEKSIEEESQNKQKLTMAQREVDAKIENIQNRMLTLGGTNGSISSVKTLTSELGATKKAREEAISSLNAIYSRKVALSLVASDTVSLFRNQVEKELATRKWQAECTALKPQKEKFLHTFASFEKYDPPLTHDQKAQLDDAINSAWESLFYPPPTDCTDRCIHTYLDDDQLRSVFDTYVNSLIGKEEIFEKIRETKWHDELISRINAQIAKLEGLDESGAIVESIKKEMEALTLKRDEFIRNLSLVENKLRADEADLEDKKAQYERENRRFLENAPTNSLLKKADKLYQFIENKLIPRLYPLKKKLLEEEMTNVYQKLAHKRHIKKIKLDEDASVHLYGENDVELDFDKSAGEAQLFATTLMAALANISGVEAPLVVDTPLGRLDSIHRGNILDFWTDRPERQVILLSQDEEIDTTLFQKLQPHILKSYVLTHVDMGNGIGQTCAREGYFGERYGSSI